MSKREVVRERSYWHHAILYPDNHLHAAAMETLKVSEWSYAYILHDKDVDADGNLKKPHWHIVIRFNNSRSCVGVAREWGIEPRFIQCSDFREDTLLYLTHDDKPSRKAQKYQYSISSVSGPLTVALKAKLDDLNGAKMDESEAVLHLLDYVDSREGMLSVSTFARYAAVNGLWSYYRRAGSIFGSVIAEHNRAVFSSRGTYFSAEDAENFITGVCENAYAVSERAGKREEEAEPVGGQYERYSQDFQYAKERRRKAMSLGITGAFYDEWQYLNLTELLYFWNSRASAGVDMSLLDSIK